MNAVEINVSEDGREATLGFCVTGWNITHDGQYISGLDGDTVIAYLQDHELITDDFASSKLIEMINLISAVRSVPQ